MSPPLSPPDVIVRHRLGDNPRMEGFFMNHNRAVHMDARQVTLASMCTCTYHVCADARDDYAVCECPSGPKFKKKIPPL